MSNSNWRKDLDKDLLWEQQREFDRQRAAQNGNSFDGGGDGIVPILISAVVFLGALFTGGE